DSAFPVQGNQPYHLNGHSVTVALPSSEDGQL
ncbi:unnamed protein product, partial [Allacma fusca]